MNALKTILPIILVALAIVFLVVFMFPKIEEPTIEETKLKHFSSYDELKSFINESYESGRYYGAEALDMVTKSTAGAVPMVAEAGAEEFSTTNIQVEGVDEPDIVKNDGKYIYTITGNKVVIIEAYPAENMEILSEINFSNTVSEIFINEDKLIVFLQGYESVPYREKSYSGYYSEYKSLVYIYNVEDKEAPELEQNFSVDGNYFDSRMINEYVYVVSTKYVNIENPEPPVYIMNGVKEQVSAEEIYYWPYYDTSYVFTSIAAINIKNGDFESKVYLTGATATIYVSQDNIYLTYQRRINYEDRFKRQVEEVYLPLLPDEEKEEIEKIMKSDKENYGQQQKIWKIIEKYSESLTGDEKAEFDEKLMKALEDFEVKIEKENEKTIIHKINVNEDEIEYEGVGEVPGYILNQFSMDEHNGNFRIATTTASWRGKSLNHLYILDEDLKIIGKVEDLAKGERIYSTRFLGDRAYIVTFKKVDPLFVIDVSNPENPEVLGYLKITGYSDYLHIYDENHIIGIGKETVAASDEEIGGRNLQFAWYQGIKISLFDVSDVENPIEKAKIVIGDRGTDSLALYEHKAFLFDKQKNLLVIPISLNEIKNKSENMPPTTYGERVWEGAYVLNINLDEISVRGKITHNEEGDAKERYGYRYFSYENQIQRSLYMDNILYTISQAKIKANNLESVDEISKVSLPYEQTSYPYPLYGV